MLLQLAGVDNSLYKTRLTAGEKKWHL